MCLPPGPEVGSADTAGQAGRSWLRAALASCPGRSWDGLLGIRAGRGQPGVWCEDCPCHSPLSPPRTWWERCPQPWWSQCWVCCAPHTCRSSTKVGPVWLPWAGAESAWGRLWLSAGRGRWGRGVCKGGLDRGWDTSARVAAGPDGWIIPHAAAASLGDSDASLVCGSLALLSFAYPGCTADRRRSPVKVVRSRGAASVRVWGIARVLRRGGDEPQLRGPGGRGRVAVCCGVTTGGGCVCAAGQEYTLVSLQTV